MVGELSRAHVTASQYYHLEIMRHGNADQTDLNSDEMDSDENGAG
jgi:hypothetical protein